MQSSLCPTWSETLKTGFLATRLRLCKTVVQSRVLEALSFFRRTSSVPVMADILSRHAVGIAVSSVGRVPDS